MLESIQQGSMISFAGFYERVSGDRVSEVIMESNVKEGIVIDIEDGHIYVLSNSIVFVLEADSDSVQIKSIG